MFIRNFFQNRKFEVRVYVNCYSVLQQHEGVPEGIVLCTTCFVIASNGISHVFPPHVRYSVYVDDLLVSYASSSKRVVQNAVQTATDDTTKWTTEYWVGLESSNAYP